MGNKRRVVVTGMGALTSIGNGVDAFWENAKKGVCGIDEITYYDTSNQKAKVAGELKNLDMTQHIEKSEMRKLDLFTKYTVIAAKEAVDQSGMVLDESNAHRCGVIVSSGIGGIDTIANEQVRGLDRGFDKVSPFFIPMSISNMAAGIVAIKHGAKGMCNCVITACASSTNAIGDAFRHIRDGYAEMMICGGTEASITPLSLGGFTSMRALNESADKNRASIPFDKERSGFVMGEGSGILFLEEYEQAVARGANILGEIVGYGSTCDAHHMTAPDPDGTGACNSMLGAMSDGGIELDEVTYINAHGTSTPMNDKGETKAIRKAFGEKADNIKVSSTKSMTGHLLGASGAIEAILTIKALQNDFAPPTINYKTPDPECDLDIVPNVGVEVKMNCGLSNSLGFGGHNATLAFRKFVK